MPKQSTIKNYGLLIDRNHRLIKQCYLKTFKELGFDITTEQWVVLDSLSRNDGLSQNDLAGKCFKDAPTLSRILNLMVDKNWVIRKRSESDGRSWLILLTDKGKKMHTKLSREVKKLRTKGWESLSDEDFEHFSAIMQTIYDNFKEEIED